MIEQLLIGTFVIIVSVFVQSAFIGLLYHYVNKSRSWYTHGLQEVKLVLLTALIVVWLVAGLTVCAWLWAIIYLFLDVFTLVEPALYYAIVTFTTLGYGDITLTTDWRLLGSLTAVNGLVVVGLNTAILVHLINKITNDQNGYKRLK